ncbi:PPOX class F420-dependent oxidoreductase [Luteimicrobium album]|uniref:PPOX class F420-dependent oxidoreductase n=1 Tax=Luteimicrobium album TaxID=1054550 RepID=A0ABQ6I782_9MICO|nr:TIGR03668 family PPOX class F420-dependent oxidoreductase [Luteimicrobium album]GMA25808.1 PPOX class F420-dependent oxidoreductase [Luteimicrobium album]
MRLDEATCRERLARVRHAHLATTGADAHPHVVPVTFALVGDDLVTAVDHKPKTTTRLRRLTNITENPRVAVLADRYDDDWTHLWWVRADGVAHIEHDGPAFDAALAALAERYPQYRADPPRGPVIRMRIERWSGWAYAEDGAR